MSKISVTEFIVFSGDYEQGLRRFLSYRKKEINSSESESRSRNDDQPKIMSSASVTQLLAKSQPISNKPKQLRRSQSADHIDTILEGLEDVEIDQNKYHSTKNLDADSREKISDLISTAPEGNYYCFVI